MTKRQELTLNYRNQSYIGMYHRHGAQLLPKAQARNDAKLETCNINIFYWFLRQNEFKQNVRKDV